MGLTDDNRTSAIIDKLTLRPRTAGEGCGEGAGGDLEWLGRELLRLGHSRVALCLLKHIAANGDINTQFMMADIYSRSLPELFPRSDITPSMAREWAHSAARSGHAKAQNLLGTLYERGDSFVSKECDLARALEWYGRAEEGGYAVARVNRMRLEVSSAQDRMVGEEESPDVQEKLQQTAAELNELLMSLTKEELEEQEDVQVQEAMHILSLILKHALWFPALTAEQRTQRRFAVLASNAERGHLRSQVELADLYLIKDAKLRAAESKCETDVASDSDEESEDERDSEDGGELPLPKDLGGSESESSSDIAKASVLRRASSPTSWTLASPRKMKQPKARKLLLKNGQARLPAVKQEISEQEDSIADGQMKENQEKSSEEEGAVARKARAEDDNEVQATSDKEDSAVQEASSEIEELKVSDLPPVSSETMAALKEGTTEQADVDKEGETGEGGRSYFGWAAYWLVKAAVAGHRTAWGRLIAVMIPENIPLVGLALTKELALRLHDKAQWLERQVAAKSDDFSSGLKSVVGFRGGVADASVVGSVVGLASPTPVLVKQCKDCISIVSRLYRFLLDAGDFSCAVGLARLLRTGAHGVMRPDIAGAVKVLREGMHGGDAASEYELSRMCKSQQIPTGTLLSLTEDIPADKRPRSDTDHFLHFMISSASKGVANAQFALGRHIRTHRSLPAMFHAVLPEQELSFNFWYEAAASKGHIKAQLELAGLFEHYASQEQMLRCPSLAIQQEMQEKSLLWYETVTKTPLSERNSVEERHSVAAASAHLGDLYTAGGLGLRPDSRKAYEYFALASDLGHASATCKLVEILMEQAFGVKMPEAGGEWKDTQLRSPSIGHLGECRSLRELQADALHRLLKAADAADARSLVLLAKIFEIGFAGSLPDYKESLACYYKACQLLVSNISYLEQFCNNEKVPEETRADAAFMCAWLYDTYSTDQHRMKNLGSMRMHTACTWYLRADQLIGTNRTVTALAVDWKLSKSFPEDDDIAIAIYDEMQEVIGRIFRSYGVINEPPEHGVEEAVLPLIIKAIVNHDCECLEKLLVEAESDTSVKTRDGSSLVDVARRNGEETMAQRLLQARAERAKDEKFRMFMSKTPSVYSLLQSSNIFAAPTPAGRRSSGKTSAVWQQQHTSLKRLEEFFIEISTPDVLFDEAQRIRMTLKDIEPSATTEALEALLERLEPAVALLEQAARPTVAAAASDGKGKLGLLKKRLGKGTKSTEEDYSRIDDIIEALDRFTSQYGSKRGYKDVFECLGRIADHYDRCRRLFAATVAAGEEERNAVRRLPTIASFVGGDGVVRRLLHESCATELAQENIRLAMISGRFFERSSLAPGLKYAAESLYCKLCGKGVPRSVDIVKVTTPTASSIFTVLTTFNRRTLADVLAEYPRALDRDAVPRFNFSSMVALGLLTTPSNIAPQSILVEVDQEAVDSLREITITGFENSVPFGASVLTDPDTLDRVLRHRNVLYLLPQMNRPVDASLMNMLFSREPEVVVMQWLEHISIKDRDFQLLLSSGTLSPAEADVLQLPIAFPPGTVVRVYRRLRAMLHAMKERPTLTHMDLLECLDPEVFHFYEALQRRAREGAQTLAECMRHLFDDKVIRGVMVRQSTRIGNFRGGPDTLTGEEQLNWNKLHPLATEAEEFIGSVEFARLHPQAADAVLALVPHVYGLQHLVISRWTDTCPADALSKLMAVLSSRDRNPHSACPPLLSITFAHASPVVTASLLKGFLRQFPSRAVPLQLVLRDCEHLTAEELSELYHACGDLHIITENKRFRMHVESPSVLLCDSIWQECFTMRILDTLLLVGADVNHTHRLLKPIHVAARIGNLEVIRWLHEHGCQLNDYDGQFLTPLDSALKYGNSEAALLLASLGAQSEDPAVQQNLEQLARLKDRQQRLNCT